MRHIATALTALAILGCGAALADDQPKAPMATPVKRMSVKACNKQADERKLTGKARADYVKECRSRTAPVPPPQLAPLPQH
jgi:hypothetical protein